MTTSRAVLALIALLTTAPAARAEVGGIGNEFQVNTYTSRFQGDPSVAATDSGSFVIVWQSGSYYSGSQDGSSSGIFGQRFDAAGAPSGSEFLVNTFTLDAQASPAVAAAPSGDFVVAWQSGNSSYYSFGAHPDGSATGVFLQRFDTAGVRQGSESRANTTTAGRQVQPAVARDASGNFVVVWQSGGYRFQQDGSGSGIFGQRFDSAGALLGPEFQVNTYTNGPQTLPAVAASPLGDFVVTWQDGYYGTGHDGSGAGIFARRFDAAGNPFGPEFQVNTYTTGQQRLPSVAEDSLGNFVIVWQSGNYSTGQDGSSTGVFGQRYDDAGMPIGGEFQVNTYTTGQQGSPSVASDADGNFVVAWENGYYGTGIFGQHFAASGVPIGLEFQVNTYTTGSRQRPHVSATPDGNFVIAWNGAYNQDGSGSGVFARRFRTTAFTAPDLVAGNRLVIRDDIDDARRKSLSVRSDDVAIDLAGGEGSIDDPTLTGGHLRVRGGTVFDDTYDLPAANWTIVGSGPSRGYQYRDSALLAGPVKAIRIRHGRFKVAARGAQLGHSLVMNPTPVTVLLQIGDRGQRYCAQYGGTIEYKPDVVYRGRQAAAPPECPR
jgi:hypothetical protein